MHVYMSHSNIWYNNYASCILIVLSIAFHFLYDLPNHCISTVF